MVINKNNMNYSKFYEFHDRMTRGAYNAIRTIDQTPFDGVKLLRGELNVNMSFRFAYHFGTKVYDLVAIGWAGIYLLSDKVINLLREHQITGWITYSTILYDKKDKEIEGYSLFSVTGRSGPIDWAKSEKFVKDPYVPGGGRADMLRGVYFDLDTWDGSDIFLADGTLYTFVTQKVRDLLVKNKVTNILLERVTEIETIDHTIPFEVDQETLDQFIKSITIK
jgi:hypothetical protein